MPSERPNPDVSRLPKLRLGRELVTADALAPAPPESLRFESSAGRDIRPWDSVWLARRGVASCGTVVEVRRERVRVAIGGMVCCIAREDILGVRERQRNLATDGSDDCRWTENGWMHAAAQP